MRLLTAKRPISLMKYHLICQDMVAGVVLQQLCDYGVCQTTSPQKIPDEARMLDLEDIEKATGKLLQRVFKKHRNHQQQALFCKKQCSLQ